MALLNIIICHHIYNYGYPSTLPSSSNIVPPPNPLTCALFPLSLHHPLTLCLLFPSSHAHSLHLPSLPSHFPSSSSTSSSCFATFSTHYSSFTSSSSTTSIFTLSPPAKRKWHLMCEVSGFHSWWHHLLNILVRSIDSRPAMCCHLTTDAVRN